MSADEAFPAGPREGSTAGDELLLSRIRMTDPDSRRRFLRYWRVVGPFSQLIRWWAFQMPDRRMSRGGGNDR